MLIPFSNTATRDDAFDNICSYCCVEICLYFEFTSSICSQVLRHRRALDPPSFKLAAEVFRFQFVNLLAPKGIIPIILRFEVVYNDRCIRETDCCRVLADEEPVDPKKYLEDSCKPKCVKPLLEYEACVKRVERDDSGHKHCTGQYFDYWFCIDKCVAPKLFSKLK
ncbi:hypothetical protein OIU78_012445 [Salix suchowensis]|nr:hypothetical protein OIU78_012445 [Salix suchowensis]